MLRPATAQLVASSPPGGFHPNRGASVLDQIFRVFGPANNQRGAAGEGAAPSHLVIGYPGWTLGGEDQADAGAAGGLEQTSRRVTGVLCPGDQLGELIHNHQHRTFVAPLKPGGEEMAQVEHEQVTKPRLRVVDRRQRHHRHIRQGCVERPPLVGDPPFHRAKRYQQTLQGAKTCGGAGAVDRVVDHFQIELVADELARLGESLSKLSHTADRTRVLDGLEDPADFIQVVLVRTVWGGH